MSFIQHDVAGGRRIPQPREMAGPGPARVTGRGLWRLGGLVGALAYSLVCWTLLFHGGRAVVAWIKPERTMAFAAEPTSKSPPQGQDSRTR
jgi:hypothetical protein